MPRGGYQERRIRKVVFYTCTTCYEAFNTKEDAKEHWAEEHGGGVYEY